jgi:hypothetical protein
VLLNLEMLINGGAFVLGIAGATPRRRNGLAWRSARGLRAGQSGDGVFREAGRASCLLDRSRNGITPAYQVPRSCAHFPRRIDKKERVIEVIDAERNAKAERRAEAVLVSS